MNDYLTVFSTTQWEHSKTQCDSCHHGFADAYPISFDTISFDFDLKKSLCYKHVSQIFSCKKED